MIAFTLRDYIQSRATFQELHFISRNPLVLRKIFALPTRHLLSQTHKITYSSSPLSQLMSLFGLVLISELEHSGIKFADVYKDTPTFTNTRGMSSSITKTLNPQYKRCPWCRNTYASTKAYTNHI